MGRDEIRHSLRIFLHLAIQRAAVAAPGSVDEPRPGAGDGEVADREDGNDSRRSTRGFAGQGRPGWLQ